jgi:hypothetical protein
MARCFVFMLPFLVSSLISTVGLPVDPPAQLLQLGSDVAGGRLSVDPSYVHEASRDFGGLSRAEPMAVFQPRGAGTWRAWSAPRTRRRAVSASRRGATATPSAGRPRRVAAWSWT